MTNLIFPWQHIWPSQGLLPQNSVSLPLMRYLPTRVQWIFKLFLTNLTFAQEYYRISGPLKVCCCNIPSIYPSWPTCLLKRSYFDLFLTNLIFPWQHIWPSQGLLPQNSVSLHLMRFLPTGVQRFDFDKFNFSVGTLILALSRFAAATFPQPQSTYKYRAPQYMSPRRNWNSPTPLAASECALPPGQRVGGHTRLRLKGWGSPNSNDWRKSLALCLLCALNWQCLPACSVFTFQDKI